tara:strand:+ start:284 stop:457 length:174 start_codon:yes stop_codon:yes gene_type:complete
MENQIFKQWAAIDETGQRVIRLFNNETQATQWVKYYRSNIDIDIRPIERKLEVLENE